MEIEREENIFYNLIKNETSLTEVFCNFMRYENFRNLFIDIVNEKIKNKENIIDKSIVKFQNFDTEVALNNQKNGRIDFQLKINNKIYLFEIKIETFTNLTDNQPKGYLDYLKELELESENLFFILPRGYLHLKEIKNHNIIYWEDILKQIRKQELDKANVFISEFCKILAYRWFDFKKIIFIENELDLIFSGKKEEGYKMLENVSIPVLISKLFQIVDNSSKKLNTKYYSGLESYEYNGYFLDNKKYELSNKFMVWFGVDNMIWEKIRNPISIQIVGFESGYIESLEKFLKNEDCFNNEKNKINFKIFEYDDNTICFYIALEKEIFENEDKNITEELTHKINEVINVLKEYK